MLTTRTGPAAGGVVNGSAQERDDWMTFTLPGSGFEFRDIMFGLGDPKTGPRCTILHCAPTEEGAGSSLNPASPDWDQSEKRGVHYHRTDQWRFQLSEDQSFYIGKDEYHFGDYYLQPACTWYFDPMGAQGMLMFQTDADRRGSIGVTRETKDLRGDEWADAHPDIVYDLSMVPKGTPYDDDAKAVRGTAISTGASIPKAGIKGSLFDTTGWTDLSDGSKVCAIFEGDAVSGPVILLSQNAPGAVEAPAGSYGSDMMRVIVKGSCTVGGRTLGDQDFRGIEAGVEETEVVHGPEGSTQVQYFADRRAWRSSGSGDDDVRAAEIAAILERTAQRVPVS